MFIKGDESSSFPSLEYDAVSNRLGVEISVEASNSNSNNVVKLISKAKLIQS